MTNAPATTGMFARADVRRRARFWPRDRYVQAALMYPRRWPARLVLAWAGLFFLLACFKAYADGTWGWADRETSRRLLEQYRTQHTRDAAEEMATIGAVLAAFALPGVVLAAAHVRDRVTDWRASVLPRYRAPHVAVGAILTAAVVLCVASSVYLITPFSFVGLLGVCAWIAAVGGCCAALPPKGVAVAGIGSVAVFSLRGLRAWAGYALLGFDEARAAVLLLTSLVPLVALWTWLALDRRERTPARPEDLMLAERAVRWRRRPGEDVTSMSLRRRVRLWRLPSSAGLMPAACGAGLFLVIVSLVFSQVSEYALGMSVPIAALSVILPVAAVATQWVRRLPAIGYEMTRPVSRRQSVRSLGLAMASDWAAWWAWLTAGGVAGIVTSATWFASNHKIVFVSNPWWSFAVAILASAAVQIALYGLIAWVLHFQTPWAVNLTALAAAMFCWVPLPYILQFVHPTIISASIALAGLLLSVDAYRRWVRADIR